ncbi:MAG: aminopeptidase P family protein [Clostridia bacterium]|nr:aminopeptidase P family protein [Clostridia bacterium]
MLKSLRAAMAAAGADMFLIPTADPHGSEYPGEHYKVRRHFSGFTGSAGTMAVTADEAGLWTDGRYFLQAERELEGSGITLFKMGQSGVPDIYDWAEANLKGTLGADFRTLTAAEGKDLANRGVKLVDFPGLIDEAWENRPPLSPEPAYSLGCEYTGRSTADKLTAVRKQMAEQGADAYIISALEDGAWLFNIRGADVKYLPVALCYGIVEKESAYLFMDEKKAAPIMADMAAAGVEVLPYNGIYSFISRYGAEHKVMAPLGKLNYRLYLDLCDRSNVIDYDAISLMKAVKNDAELKYSRLNHLKDGVAVSRFIRWIKQNAHKGITEMQAGEKMGQLRREQEGCMDESFSTICGYGPHAAIVHYSANADTDIPIEPHGLLLVDSGGQYYGGTTDITRTISMGPVPYEQKVGYTLVLEGMLALMDAKFPKGCAGYHLDAIARMPLWQRGMDYNHGTGHGVGCMLSVHEGPNGFRWQKTSRSDRGELMPGMITSDEPGVYVENQYGVRIENLVECVEEENGFLGFRSLTFAPIDLDAVDIDTLTEQGRERLNRYHKEVYEKLSPLMTEDEREWLKQETREI